MIFDACCFLQCYGFSAEGQRMIALEYAPEGNLFNYVWKQRPLSPTELWALAVHIGMALSLLHNKLGRAHLDVKLNNILWRPQEFGAQHVVGAEFF